MVTVPGESGVAVALLAEVAITFVLMLTVLFVSNAPRLARYTGLFVGGLVFLYITFEAPLSGMSMNPARTFGSALAAGDTRALWIYFTAPPVGMVAAASLYRRIGKGLGCAKLYHPNDIHCIFCEE